MKSTFLLISVFGSIFFLFPACDPNQPREAAVDTTIDMSAVPEVKYLDPIVINKGGTYTGNYKSTDSQTPAIWVQTNEPVEITGCIIVSTGDMIKCSGG